MIESIQFASFAEFLQMGGYAFNVWSVYALFAMFVAFNLILPALKRKSVLRSLQRREAFEKTETSSQMDFGTTTEVEEEDSPGEE